VSVTAANPDGVADVALEASDAVDTFEPVNDQPANTYPLRNGAVVGRVKLEPVRYVDAPPEWAVVAELSS
jgi:hypothetical protein